MGIAFFGSECAKLTRENADIGIVDVTVNDVSGVVTIFSLPHRACHDPKRVEIIGTVQFQSLHFGNALPSLDFLSDRPKFLWNKCVIHPQPRLEISVIIITRPPRLATKSAGCE
jgi:hypothetical protein